jgi:hypothetical protein
MTPAPSHVFNKYEVGSDTVYEFTAGSGSITIG